MLIHKGDDRARSIQGALPRPDGWPLAMRHLLLAFALLAALVAAAAPAPPRLASLSIPGDPKLVAVARDVIDVRVALAPNLAAEAGLVDDAVRVPSFAPAKIAALQGRLRGDLDRLAGLKRKQWTLDEQIDARWLQANAEEALQRLTVERRWRHRPAEWLEPVANTFIALAANAPERPELSVRLAALIPDMLAEMKREVAAPTARDLTTARELTDALIAAMTTIPGESATASLKDYRAWLDQPRDLPEYEVIGAESYAWRLKHAMLQPWTPDELLDRAERELAAVDAEIASLEAEPPPPPTAEDEADAAALTREGHLALYDRAVAENLAALRAMDVLTVPADLPPLQARETPAAIIALSGDGGSMNPPPLFGPPVPGFWNVDHFSADWTAPQRLDTVTTIRNEKTTWFGTYAVHEGVPGHHLQLAIARANPDPLRTLLTDYAAVEGWALYAEQLFWEGGGLGDSNRSHLNMLRSYRGRIRRIYYDVNVETGRWTLQQAAEWRADKPGVEVDRDVLRAIQWPTQLIGYFTGKVQILDLRQEARERWGAAYTDRRFNDELLSMGQVPISLVRARMLGDPIPE